jgi:hypothetical protein
MEENNVVNDVVGESAQTDEQSQKITFDNEKAFMDRVKREAKKQQADFIKALGFENDGQLKEIIQKQREQEQASKTEYEKLQEQLQQKTEYINKVNQNLKQNEIKMQMLNAGIKSEKINYAMKLIDVNDIDFNDGVLDTEKLNNSLNVVLTDFPELKGVSSVKSAGQDFNNSTPPDLLSMDVIKNMSQEETQKRLPEILKFLEKNK